MKKNSKNIKKKFNVNSIFKNIKKKNKLSRAKEDFFKLTDIPIYMQNDVARMSVYSNSKVYIEQYESIADYFTHYIKIICKNMYVIIEGKDLDIAEITDTDLLINGKIDSISYKKVGGQN